MEVQPWQTPFSSIPAALQDTGGGRSLGVPTSQGYMEGPKNNNKSLKVLVYFQVPRVLVYRKENDRISVVRAGRYYLFLDSRESPRRDSSQQSRMFEIEHLQLRQPH